MKNEIKNNIIFIIIMSILLGVVKIFKINSILIFAGTFICYFVLEILIKYIKTIQKISFIDIIIIILIVMLFIFVLVSIYFIAKYTGNVSRF